MKRSKPRRLDRADVAIRVKATPEKVVEALFRSADLKVGIKSPFTERRKVTGKAN